MTHYMESHDNQTKRLGGNKSETVNSTVLVFGANAAHTLTIASIKSNCHSTAQQHHETCCGAGRVIH